MTYFFKLMGVVGSKLYGCGRRFVLRYNVEERTHKYLDKEKLAPAPRHEKRPGTQLSREALEDIHCKNIQLNEHLKKVYLTSTSVITGTPSKRPKPKKENEQQRDYMFYEPETPAPGHCTLSNVIEILLKFDSKSVEWNVDAIAEKFKLAKKDVVLLLSYYSIFRHEKFDFMNMGPKDPQKVEFEVFNQLEKKPLRKLESK